jgi:hypothetical protein
MDDLDEDDVEETMQHTVRDIQVSTVNVEQDNDVTGHEDEVDMVADRGHEREKEEQVQLSSSFIKSFHVIFDGDDLHMCAYFLIHVLSVYFLLLMYNRKHITSEIEVGRAFQSEDDAYGMYNTYARKVGFSIRNDKIHIA